MKARLLLLFVIAAGASCAPKQNYTVVLEDPAFRDLDFSQATVAVVPPADGVQFSPAAIAVVDDPAGRARRIMETLGEYLRGDFEFYRSIQGNVRGHCRRNIAYVDSPDDLAAIRGAVVFTEGEYGIRTASIHDAEALSDLSEARSWDYLVFLEDLTLDLLFTDYYEPLTGTLRTEEDLKLVAQVFLASASTAKVLYQGYVTGKADDSLYSNRMELSFVGNLIRGPLRLR